MNQKTCKDCIHHEVCKYKDEKVSLGTKVCELVADGFKCFKDKTRNEFGKTVFLTKEEAEKALERMKEDEKNNIAERFEVRLTEDKEFECDEI